MWFNLFKQNVISQKQSFFAAVTLRGEKRLAGARGKKKFGAPCYNLKPFASKCACDIVGTFPGPTQ